MEREDHLQLFLGISIALHALVFLLYLSPFLMSLKLPALPPAIELVELPGRRPAPAPPPLEPPLQPRPPEPETPVARPPEPLPPEPLPKPPPSQDFKDVVEIPKPAKEEPPRDARIHSAYDQRVPRPARARDLPVDNRGAVTERREADALARPSLADTKERGAEAQEKREAQRSQAESKAGGGEGTPSEALTARSDTPGMAGSEDALPRPLGPDAVFRRTPGGAPRLAGRPGRRGRPGAGSGIEDLLPKEERLAQLEKSPPGGRMNPYNPALTPVDAKMSMDTLRDENVGYWLALKNRIALNWDPNRLVRAAVDDYERTVENFGSGNALAQSAHAAIAAAAARTGLGRASIRFTIAKDGSLEGKPEVIRTSGSKFLDEEALKAVTLGYPFPPVPDRIAKRSLTLEWSFILGKE